VRLLARARVPRRLLGRMLWGDFVEHSHLFADDSFDLVFDSSAMYADSLTELEQCVSEVHRIAAKGAIFYYYDLTDSSPDEVARYDRYATVLPPQGAWLEALWRAGFTVAQPYTFEGRYCFDVLFGLKRR